MARAARQISLRELNRATFRNGVLLAYAPPHRVRLLPERYRRAVIAVNGDVAPTFLLDGLVAGTWSVERTGGQVILRLAPEARSHSVR